MKIKFCFWLVILLVGCETKNSTKDDETDTIMLKSRFEHSDDLVNKLEGIELYKTYEIMCNDGRVRSVKVALLDRKQNRVGFVALQGVESLSEENGGIGGRAYDDNALAFVGIDWFLYSLNYKDERR